MNINEMVWVRLTPRGEKILEDYFAELEEGARNGYRFAQPKRFYERAKESSFKDGYWRFELWYLMNIFGPKCYNGSDALFEGHEIHTQCPIMQH